MPRCGTGGWVISMHRAWIFYASETELVSHSRGLSWPTMFAPWESSTACLPKTANHKVNQPFQLYCGGLFTPVTIGGYKYTSKITNEYIKWTAVYLLTKKNQPLQLLQLFVGLAAIPFGGRIACWRADKGGEYTGEEFRQYCLETGII